MEEEFDNAIDIDEQTENLKNKSLKTPSNNRWRFLFDFNTSCFCKVRNHSLVLFTISPKSPDHAMQRLNSSITILQKRKWRGIYSPPTMAPEHNAQAKISLCFYLCGIHDYVN